MGLNVRGRVRRGSQARRHRASAAAGQFLSFLHRPGVRLLRKILKDLLGYEPKQILLLHGNWLEADHIAEVLDLLHKRGYRFITLQDALSDAAYSIPDDFIGEEGTKRYKLD